jgi:3-hydroxymyristoyl/3-hydroxydecanoyl-(acyl carrier protein) dehydratase
MSRVTAVDGPLGGMHTPSKATIAYDVPRDAWYYAENGARTMPFSVLLETALQPCGWLASYAGGALGSDEDLCFRNLDGTGTQHREITDDVGTITTTTTLKSISTAGSMVIVGFDVALYAGDALLYSLDTVFGFFPADAMANQAGLPTTDEARAALVEPGGEPIDLVSRPARFFDGSLCLARGEKLLMIDRVTGLWPAGGAAGLGRLRAEKSIEARQWFFKAHFYTDPVQPGSLGMEALLQAVQALVIAKGIAEGIERPRFETQAPGVAMTWKYRGQVVPTNETVVTDVEITEIVRADGAVRVVAKGSLWVDGKRIYEARGLAVRVVAGSR